MTLKISNLDDENKNILPKEKYWTQYLCTFAVTLTLLIAGIHMGWIGPTLPKLEKFLSISDQDSVWLANFVQAGSLPGPFLGSYLSDKLGRQKTLFLTTFPNLIAFLLIYFANDIWFLYLARFCGGISVGFSFVAAPAYIAEISSPNVRGILGSMVGLMIGVGLIFEYVVIPLVTIQQNALICIALVSISGILIFMVPETPYFCIMKNSKEKSISALEFFRRSKDVSKECTDIELSWLANKDHKSTIIDFFKFKYNRHYFAIIVGIFGAQAFSGMLQILSYSPGILDDFGTSISVSTGGMALISSFTLATLMSSFYIDKWGRKPLLYISTFGGGVSLILIGAYLYMKLYNLQIPNVHNLSLIPFITLLIYMICYGLGLNSLPYIYIPELFPTNSLAIAASLAQFASSILFMLSMQLFELIRNSCGTHWSFLLYGLLNIVSGLFGLLFVPETKGKILCEALSLNKLDKV